MRMINPKFKNIKISFFICLFLLISSSLFAASHSLIVDECGILTDSEKTSLQEQANQLEDNFQIAAYIVLVNDSEMTDVESYSEAYYKYNNFGYGDEKTGIMLLLNFDQRDYDILCYGQKAHEVYTDRTKAKIAGDFKPYFRNNEWYDGCSQFLISAHSYIRNLTNRNVPEVRNNVSGIGKYIDMEVLINALIVGFGLALIISLICCFAMKAKMKSVKTAKRADRYVVEKEIHLSVKHDQFTHNTTVVHNIAQNQSNHTSVNSGGFSHSSGKF